MVYDPTLVSFDADGQSHNLAIDSALAHPEVPMLLACSPDSVPDAGIVREIRAHVPHVHVAAHHPEALLRQVRALLQRARTELEVIT